MSSTISEQITDDLTNLLTLSGESGWRTSPLRFGPLPGVVLEILLTSAAMADLRATSNGQIIPAEWARAYGRCERGWYRRYRLCWDAAASNPWTLRTLTPNDRYAHMRQFRLFADAVILIFDELETATW
ncbi:hypothetical protein [Nocardia sp. IFM 10818]